MEATIKQVYNSLPSKAFVTATTDRGGGEFACFAKIGTELQVKLYFADPYCSHQRGSNEHGNGLLREFYPKGTNLGGVSHEELKHSLDLINNRPRKCIGWISPVQAFNIVHNSLSTSLVFVVATRVKPCEITIYKENDDFLSGEVLKTLIYPVAFQ